MNSIDLSTPDGLRDIQRNFGQIYKDLYNCYNDSSDSDSIQTGILMIWTRMYSNQELRDHLLARDVHRHFFEGYLITLTLNRFYLQTSGCA
jgi:hypothetical protein